MATRSAKLRLDEAQRRVLRLLRTGGPLSRIGVAGRLELSATAMTSLSRSLLDLGLIEEAALESGAGRGRPAVPLRIAPRGGYSIGVALHRGVLEVTLVDFAGQLIEHAVETFDDLTPRDCARRISGHLHSMVQKHSLLTSRFFGLGVGVPGPPRPERDGRWMIVPALAGWRDEPLVPMLEEELGVPIWVENDANAAALAEHYLDRSGHSSATTLVALLGHGLGAGVVANGQLLTGEAGNAGDIGCLFPAHRPRPSTVDLLKTLQAAGCNARSATDVEQALLSHPKVIASWIKRAAGQLRACIDAGVVWLNPGRVIISSPLPLVVLQRLADRMNAAGFADGYYSEYPVRVECSTLGGTAIALGAALLPIHAVEASL